MTAVSTSIRVQATPRVQYVLRIADTCLIHAQRQAEWCGHGPVLEEDIALTNMALDLVGQARALLTHAARLEGQGFDEDQLAFLRDERQYFNLTLVEQPMRRCSVHAPGGDFADTVLRHFLLATWLQALWTRWAASGDVDLVASARLFPGRGYTATTMNDVATACGVSKATLYHCVRDKQDLFAHITAGHLARLQSLVLDVTAQPWAPEARLRELIHRFMQACASAQERRRLLTEVVKFLRPTERERVLPAQRRVAAAVADAVAGLRPDLGAAQMHEPLAQLLFGMIKGTFTWLCAGGALSHQTLAPVVAALFLGGLPAVAAKAPGPRSPVPRRGSARAPAPGRARWPAPARPRRRPRPG